MSPRLRTRLARLAFTALASTAAGALAARPPAADPISPEWRETFRDFERADRERPPQPGGVVFVGSSSIRLWGDLETVFGPKLVVLKRGFGGSRMEDCKAYAKQLVVQYKPRLVVVYAGENDLAEGRTPQQVLEAFAGFVEGVRAALPESRIAYVSIKPSPLREPLIPAIRTTNAMIREYVEGAPDVEYIDVFSRMLDERGRPREELYREDRLHLNEAGYALWKGVIASYLR